MTAWLGFLLSAALLSGLVGGVHCAAMCGGIVAACASRTSKGTFDWRRMLAYNAGRISAYALAGAAAGVLGSASIAMRGTATTHHVLLGFSGVALMMTALYIGGVSGVARSFEAAGSLVWRRIQPCSKAFLPADTASRALGLGIVWGWLPCGMVYAALVSAAASANALHGALVMVAFGLGTLPNLLAVALLADRVRRAVRRPTFRAAAALGIGALGVIALLAAAGAPLIPDNGLFCLLPATLAGH